MTNNSPYSPLDAISGYLSGPIRSMEDYMGEILGTSTQILRIKKEFLNVDDNWAGTGRDDFGETGEQRLELDIINNTILKYPFSNKAWVFQEKQGQQTVTFGITPEENLPIEMHLRFKGNYNTEPVALQKDDVIIDYFIDENSNKIPIYLQITQIFGTFFGKNIVRKVANLAPYRGTFEKSLREKVKLYFANLG